MAMLSQKKQDSMDIVDGLTLGIGGTILTILGFGIALFLGTYTKEKKVSRIVRRMNARWAINLP